MGIKSSNGTERRSGATFQFTPHPVNLCSSTKFGDLLLSQGLLQPVEETGQYHTVLYHHLPEVIQLGIVLNGLHPGGDAEILNDLYLS